MNARQILTGILIILGGFLAIMPLSEKYPLHANPGKLLSTTMDTNFSFSPDQVARLVVNEDSTFQLIDVRTPLEYRQSNIPGSVNFPCKEFLVRDAGPILDRPGIKNIFYSNGDMDAGYALFLANGLGFKNCYVMKGGLNSWYEIIMRSEFPAGSISARENALYETRLKARRLFTQVNSMPDSLKLSYMASKRFDPKKLDGGCE